MAHNKERHLKKKKCFVFTFLKLIVDRNVMNVLEVYVENMICFPWAPLGASYCLLEQVLMLFAILIFLYQKGSGVLIKFSCNIANMYFLIFLTNRDLEEEEKYLFFSCSICNTVWFKWLIYACKCRLWNWRISVALDKSSMGFLLKKSPMLLGNFTFFFFFCKFIQTFTKRFIHIFSFSK